MQLALEYRLLDHVEPTIAALRDSDRLATLFLELACGDRRPPRSLREQIGWWLYWDSESTYGERLGATVAEITGAPARPKIRV